MKKILMTVFDKFREFLCRMNLALIKCSTLKMLVKTSKEYEHIYNKMQFLKYINDTKLRDMLNIIEFSKGQIQQDLFVLLAHNFKKNGFFVEFGATNGIDLSNTWILEKKFEWNGILAEPSRGWYNHLAQNRKCTISTKCVYNQSGKAVLFNETDEGGFSTIDSYSSGDYHFESRKLGKKYEVETISLNDLLTKHNAPAKIDYLSIDTEGSEYDILAACDFDKWNISVITVEHNYTTNREKIRILLESNGFIRVLSSISQFDDWYVKTEFMDVLNSVFSLESGV